MNKLLTRSTTWVVAQNPAPGPGLRRALSTTPAAHTWANEWTSKCSCAHSVHAKVPMLCVYVYDGKHSTNTTRYVTYARTRTHPFHPICTMHRRRLCLGPIYVLLILTRSKKKWFWLMDCSTKMFSVQTADIRVFYCLFPVYKLM